jgi:hypothetical protein
MKITEDSIKRSFYDAGYFYAADDAAEFIINNPGAHFDVAKARSIAEMHGLTDEDKNRIFAHIAALCCDTDVNTLIEDSEINEYNDMLRSMHRPSHELINTDVIEAKILYEVYSQCSVGVNYGFALGDFLSTKIQSSFTTEEAYAKVHVRKHVPKRMLLAHRLKSIITSLNS